MTEDERLKNLDTISRLRGQSFIRKAYAGYRQDWDHDHCALCWVKLAEPSMAGDGMIHEGYAVTEAYEKGADYEWVCSSCFDVAKDKMSWRDATP